ncbi:unnamed protein product [Mytilus coruscus]|uniref:Uncharacterized protein n=1 Tax=Mytilus coruscus TaxID=42192 RepID=A0A6J8AN85_MYTCO|nr:unnamed protein product [Mytilus coruscus]
MFTIVNCVKDEQYNLRIITRMMPIWFIETFSFTNQNIFQYVLLLPYFPRKSCLHCFLISAYYHKEVSLKQTGIPELRLGGYTRNLPTMPPKDVFQDPWPKSDAWAPPQRAGRGDYYGYYHEAIEAERRRKKELPEACVSNPETSQSCDCIILIYLFAIR